MVFTCFLLLIWSCNENTTKKKGPCQIVDFAIPTDHRVKLKESGKRDKYQDLARELKELGNMKVIAIPIVIAALSIVIKGLVQGLKDNGNERTNEDHPNYSIVEISQNTKSPGDLLSLRLQRKTIS